MKCEGQHISSKHDLKAIEFRYSKTTTDQQNIISSFQNFFVEKYENVSYDITIENSAPFITIEALSIDRPIKLLIDTGASVSLILSQLLSPKAVVQNHKCKLFGLGSSENGILSEGLLHTNTTINGISLGLSLHVIDQKYIGSIDGFLGFDFLMNYNTNIDIRDRKINFKLKDLFAKSTNQGNTEEKIKENIIIEENIEEKNHNYNDFYPIETHNESTNNSINEIPEPIEIKLNNEHFIENISTRDEYYDYMEAVYFFKSEEENSEKFKVHAITDKSNIYPKASEKILRYNSSPSNYLHLRENQEINQNIEKYGEQSMQINACNFGTIYHNNGNQEQKTIGDRMKFIYDELKISHCKETEEEFIENICKNFPYQFYVEGDNLGSTSVIKHYIKLIPDSKIINIKQYRIPHTHRKILLDIVKDYENQGIIEKCQSNYNSPAILVPKKDDDNEKKDYRFVVDYRKLNEICLVSNFPIPHIDDILDGLGGCKYFTTLDIKGAFHQIVLDEASRDYTAFTAGHFHYRWVRMPMGLSDAPLTWQRAINTILANVIGKGVYIYLDDVIIYGKTFEEHNKNLVYVMNRLKENNLQLKISKCNFYAKKFDYLGFVISESGISANPKKMESIKNFSVPKNVKQVQSFLGILNYYRRFIRNFAKMAKPLTTLCKQDIPFIWTANTQNAFDTLKKALIEDVVLKFPNFDEIFYVTTDASDVAIGAVLSQGELPHDRPIFFFSRTLNECQKRYSTIQKELLAIVEAIKSFRVYLYLRFFILITDHKPLCYLFNMKDCSSRLFRQRLDLMEYNFKILHRAGAQNTVADALSRIEPISIQEV